jgi:hypothetical protein
MTQLRRSLAFVLFLSLAGSSRWAGADAVIPPREWDDRPPRVAQRAFPGDSDAVIDSRGGGDLHFSSVVPAASSPADCDDDRAMSGFAAGSYRFSTSLGEGASLFAMVLGRSGAYGRFALASALAALVAMATTFGLIRRTRGRACRALVPLALLPAAAGLAGLWRGVACTRAFLLGPSWLLPREAVFVRGISESLLPFLIGALASLGLLLFAELEICASLGLRPGAIEQRGDLRPRGWLAGAVGLALAAFVAARLVGGANIATDIAVAVVLVATLLCAFLLVVVRCKTGSSAAESALGEGFALLGIAGIGGVLCAETLGSFALVADALAVQVPLRAQTLGDDLNIVPSHPAWMVAVDCTAVVLVVAGAAYATGSRLRPIRALALSTLPSALAVLAVALSAAALHRGVSGVFALAVWDGGLLARSLGIELPTSEMPRPRGIADAPVVAVDAQGKAYYDDSRGQKAPLPLPDDFLTATVPRAADPWGRPPFVTLMVDRRTRFGALLSALAPLTRRGYVDFAAAWREPLGGGHFAPRLSAVEIPNLNLLPECPQPLRSRFTPYHPFVHASVTVAGVTLEVDGGSVAAGCKEQGRGPTLARSDRGYDIEALRVCAARIHGASPDLGDLRKVALVVDPDVAFDDVAVIMGGLGRTAQAEALFSEPRLVLAGTPIAHQEQLKALPSGRRGRFGGADYAPGNVLRSGQIPVGIGAVVASHDGTAEISAPKVEGKIANAERVVAGMRAGFRACYNRALATTPTLAGAVKIAVAVGAEGETIDVKIVPARGKIDDDTMDCLRRRAHSAEFAPPDTGKGSVDFTVTLSIKP